MEKCIANTHTKGVDERMKPLFDHKVESLRNIRRLLEEMQNTLKQGLELPSSDEQIS